MLLVLYFKLFNRFRINFAWLIINNRIFELFTIGGFNHQIDLTFFVFFDCLQRGDLRGRNWFNLIRFQSENTSWRIIGYRTNIIL